MKLSIIIPTNRRATLLKDSLESVFGQDYPLEDYEVIVVADGIQDSPTYEVIETFRREFSNFSYLELPFSGGPAAARNLGIRHSKGEIVGFTDDDCILDKSWVRGAIESHRQHLNVAVIGGRTNINPLADRVLVGQVLSNGAIKIKRDSGEDIVFFPTCNISLKREVFDRHKFDESFLLAAGEDLDFCWRLFQDGFKFLQDRKIEVFHNRHNNIGSFLKQSYSYGRGNYLVQYRHKNHPLLKELKTGKFSFWAGTAVNFIKIPRFAYLVYRRLIQEYPLDNIFKRLHIYLLFVLHKIFYLWGNIREFLETKKDRGLPEEFRRPLIPQLLILDVTHSCNLSCRICDIWKTARQNDDLSLSHIKKIFNEANRLGVKEIALSGGEPFVRRDIFEIFSYARSLKVTNLGVLTNGLLIARFFEKLKPYLIDNTISPVISFDSLDAAVHNYIRSCPYAWQETYKILGELSLLKKEHPQVNFNVISVILNQNLEELLRLADFIKSTGANSLQFQGLLSNNLKMAQRRESVFCIPADRLPVLDDIIDRLVEFKKRFPLFIKNSAENLLLVKKYFRGTLAPGDVRCLSAEKTVLISNRGECTTCFTGYGNIKQLSLREVLAGSQINRAQEKVKDCPWPCLLPCFCDT